MDLAFSLRIFLSTAALLVSVGTQAAYQVGTLQTSPSKKDNSPQSPDEVFTHYCQALGQALSWDLNVTVLPPSRFQKAVRNSDLDFLIAPAKDPELEKNYEPLSEIHHLTGVLLGLKPAFRQGTVGRPAVVGRPKYAPCYAQLDSDTPLEYFDYEDTQVALQMLAKDRLDAICTIPEIFEQAVENSPLKGQHFVNYVKYQNEVPVMIYANKKLTPAKLHQLKTTLSKIEKTWKANAGSPPKYH